MATLFRNDWSLLWTPNADELNGDPRGLIRADNLVVEEDKSLSLIRGTEILSLGSFHTGVPPQGIPAGEVTQLYSKTFDLKNRLDSPAHYLQDAANAKVRYAVAGNKVIRNWSKTVYSTPVIPNTTNNLIVFDNVIINGNAPRNIAAFGYGYGHVFISYAGQFKKDDGFNVTDVGLPPANAPYQVLAQPGPTIKLSRTPNVNPWFEDYRHWEPIPGWNTVQNGQIGYVEFAGEDVENPTAPNGIENIAATVQGALTPINIDTTLFPLIWDPNQYQPNVDTPEDVFSMGIRIADTTRLKYVTFTFFLTQPTLNATVLPTTPDYFVYTWRPETTEFIPGVNAWQNLKCTRKDFTRQGDDANLGWKTIRGYKVAVGYTENPQGQNTVLNSLYFQGSEQGPLNGDDIEYCQVDVCENGIYTDKSPPSAPYAEKIKVQGGTALITPFTPNSPICTHIWIYRRGGGLNDWYRIHEESWSTGQTPGAFFDTMSNENALLFNERLDSFQRNIPEEIIGMECNWKGRNWYISTQAIYPSYIGNPGYHDSRYVIETSRYFNEQNLFITRLNNDTMILATTVDFYEITGSGGIIEQDGVEFFEVNIRPLGIQPPSIGPDFAVREGNLFYIAVDGIRILSGSSCILMTQAIDMLFKNYNRYGINPIDIKTALQRRYYLGISKNILYFTFPKQFDNKRAIIKFSFEDKTWAYEDHSVYGIDVSPAPTLENRDAPMALFVEEDDTVIYGTAGYGDGFIRQLDVNQSVLPLDYRGLAFNTGTDQNPVGSKFPISFKFHTIWDANGQPRNRKDSFTLKLHVDTFNKIVHLKLRGAVGLSEFGKNDSQSEFALDINTGTTGPKELVFQIYNTVGLTKYYKLELEGNCHQFKLWNWSVDYDPRPEQLTNLLIKPDNYGIAGRKRINAINMLIDTMKYTVVFTPHLDDIAQTPEEFQTTTKRVYNYLFTENKIAYNVGGLLTTKEAGGAFEFYGLVNPREHELLPDTLKYKWVPYTNLGNGSRKRFIQYALTIDTFGQVIRMTPFIDGVAQPTAGISTFTPGPGGSRKQTYIYTFDTFAVGVEVACELKIDPGGVGFEFYGVNLQECITEKLPPLAETTHIPYTNFNTSARKRVQQFALIINTFNADVEYVPYIDGVSQTPININTNGKRTVIFPTHYFAVGVDFGGLLKSKAGTDFEFYGVAYENCVYEKLPPLSAFLHIAYTNFDTSSRKRIQQYAFVIDTFGNLTTFQPFVDGVAIGQPMNFSTNGKDTVIYTYANFAIGVDIGGTLTTNGEFEFYGLNLEACVYEKLPPLAESLHIAYTNFNTTVRKKMAQYAFVIDTFGKSVRFIPYIDGIQAGEAYVFSTNRKETVIYTYSTSSIGVDIGGTLESTEGADFEFYGVALDSAVYEKLPPKIQYMELQCTNYGIAARKRIRTIPMVLDTFGHDVVYTPRVDGVPYPSTTFNTTDKSTVLHYFEDKGDGTPFGIDYCGTLRGDFDFEFYQLLKPENVELLPVGKKYDQFGPVEFNKTGKIREISIRMVHTGDEFHFVIYSSDYAQLSGKMLTMPNIEKCYVISLPKGINPNIFRMEISSDKVFHRFDCFVKVNIDGAQTQNKWVKVK